MAKEKKEHTEEDEGQRDTLFVQKILDGNPAEQNAAWAEIHKIYRAYLLKIIRKYVKNDEQAEEVLQEVFVYVARKIEAAFPLKNSLKSWLGITARARAIDRDRLEHGDNRYKLRRKDPLYLEDMKLADSGEAPVFLRETSDNAETMLVNNDWRTRLQRAVKYLSEKQRQAVLLHFMEDKDMSEVGEIMGVTESRISQILSQACKLLAVRMERSDVYSPTHVKSEKVEAPTIAVPVEKELDNAKWDRFLAFLLKDIEKNIPKLAEKRVTAEERLAAAKQRLADVSD